MVDDKPACIKCAYAGVDYRLECRIKPPSPNYKSYGRMFPIMEPEDWCSKYKARPKLETQDTYQATTDTEADDDD
jgi:hypothetical protein